MAFAIHCAWDKPARKAGWLAAALAALGLAACGQPLTDSQVADKLASQAVSVALRANVAGQDLQGTFSVRTVVRRPSGVYDVCGYAAQPLSVDSEPFAVRVDGLEAGPVYFGNMTRGACDA